MTPQPADSSHARLAEDRLPDIRDWLRENPGLGTAELVDALQRDQLRRWREGERVPAEAYLQLLAGVAAADDGQTLDLIYAEFLLRREQGESPSLEEYVWRFPAHARQLRVLVDLESQLEAEPPTVSARSYPASTRDLVAPKSELSHSGGAPQVGGYELFEELGRGGMGVVYKARHRALNRPVALKIIQAADEEAVARFRVEAEAVARLQHPNIVQIHEVGEADDDRGTCPYMALELVDGGTLARRLREAPPSARQSAELLETVARAVHFAHQRGILHRDLKPANILLAGEAGEGVARFVPKVTDFGLAKRLDEADTARTRTGAVLGTPAYMAPEQASGNVREIDTRTDVYALGVILYECLAGQPPFQGQTPLDTMEQVRSHDPVPPGRVRAGIPRDLETVCLKCLRKEPGRRYGSAEALADDLRRFLDGEPIQARRVGPVGRLARWGRRNPGLASALGVAALAVAVAVALGFRGVARERDQFRGERDEAKANLYRALVGEARAQMKGRETGWWWLAMDNIRDAARLDVPGRDPAALRELAIECMSSQDPCLRVRGTWEGHDGPVSVVACSPDGRLAVSGGQDGTVRIWSVPDGNPLAIIRGHTDRITGVAFGLGGKLLATASADGDVKLWNPADPAVSVRSYSFAAGPVTCLAGSPDGIVFAVALADRTIRVLRWDAGQSGPILTGHTEPAACMAFSRTGEFASGGADRTIRFWDLTAGKQTQSWPVQSAPTTLAFSDFPELQGLAWGDGPARGFQTRVLNRGEPITESNVHGAGVTTILRADGDLWLTASADGTMKLWREIVYRMREVAVARGEFGAVLAAAVCPNGGGVIAGYRDGRVRLWEMAWPVQSGWCGYPSHHAVFVGDDGRLVDREWVTDLSAGLHNTHSRRYTPAEVRALAVHPAGQSFTLGRADGSLESWDLPEYRELARWSGHGRAVTALADSPDGRHLASASLDGTVKIWHREGNRPDRMLEPGIGGVHAVAWDRDGRYLAASGERGVVLWDLQAADKPHRLSEQALPVSAVAFGPGVVAFSAADGVIELRDLRTDGARHLRGHGVPVSVLVFSPDGKQLASGAADDSVRVWDITAGTEIYRTRAVLQGSNLAFDPDGNTLAVASSPVVFHDLRQRREIAQVYGGSVTGVGFTPDGASLLIGGRAGSVMSCPMERVRAARADATGATGPVHLKDVLAPVIHGGHTEGVWGIAGSPDGRWVATAGHDQTVKLWDATTMRLVRTLVGHGAIAWAVAFSPDSRHLATGSADIRIWEVESGRLVQTFLGHTGLATALAFHPHRPWLVSSSFDRSVRIWDLSEGKPLGVIHTFGQAIVGVALRPDGRRLVATDGSRVAVWDVGDAPPAGPPQRHLHGHTTSVWSLAFSPDGRTLASGADQGIVILWDGDTYDRMVTLRTGTGQHRGLCFTRDGSRLAATGYTAHTVVWDLAAIRRRLREMALDW